MLIQTLTETDNTLYNLSHLHTMCSGDTVFMSAMLKLFVETTTISCAEMTEALANNDLPKISTLAHKLKPGIDTMYIVSLKQVIRELETEGKSGMASENFQEKVELVLDTLHRCREQLRAALAMS